MSLKTDLDKFSPRIEQQDTIDFIDSQYKQNKENKFFLLNLPVGSGKAQPLYSKILTPSGWMLFSDIKEGDSIITPSGRISKIIKLHEVNLLPTYRITFEDGRIAECTENHLWKVYHQDYSKKWKILNTLKVLEKFNSQTKKTKYLSIPLISNKDADIDLPLDPYILGCLIGDGGLTQKSLKFTSVDKFIVEKLKQKLNNINCDLSKLSSKYGYGISNVLNPVLEKLGILYKKSEHKFIPDIYKRSGFNQKIELINGLLDTDGGVEKGSVYYSTSSEVLALDFQKLIWSIGGTAKISKKIPFYRDKLGNKKIGLINYIVRIRYKNPRILFSLPRKVERTSENYQYSDLKLRIKSIEKLDNLVETRCISIDDEEELYITDNYIVTHNSHLALMIADWYLKNVHGGAKIDVITNSKILQDQYINTYDSINDLKGKENYSCQQYACSCAQGGEFNRLNKTSCEFCPHSSARDGFISGKVSLTNFYLYILYALYIPKMLEARSANVLIVDECLHPDTFITLADGSQVEIKNIKIGDFVKTINEDNHQIENKPVVKLHHNLNKGIQMYELEMENGDILKITGNHKVKLIDGSWKKVEDLIESDEILYIKEKIELHEFDNRGKEQYI